MNFTYISTMLGVTNQGAPMLLNSLDWPSVASCWPSEAWVDALACGVSGGFEARGDCIIDELTSGA